MPPQATEKAPDALEITGIGSAWRRVILRAYADLCGTTVAFASNGVAVIEGPRAKVALTRVLFDTMQVRIEVSRLLDDKDPYSESEKYARLLTDLVERSGLASRGRRTS